MHGCVIEQATGKFRFYGVVKASLMDGDQLKPGYTLLDVPPPEGLFEPVWNGSQWVAGEADVRKATEETNATSIRDALLDEIDAVLTEADALQAILDQWEATPPNNAAVLAHVKRITRDLIRLARDVVRLVRLELRKLDQA